MIGTKLAHYEITSHLGTGGMGDVYQATDSKLGRSVAIKLLPEAFASDAERLARFRPRSAGAGVAESSQHCSDLRNRRIDGERFLVMELVEGETLAERIKRGPIPVDEALPIAKQIAEALEAAHEKGIIHRDLKPAQHEDHARWKVKVLDFGLAKALRGASRSRASVQLADDDSMAATNAGVILGTAAYMSPEQARGQDGRPAHGHLGVRVVVYEMLTGQCLFGGETVSDTLIEVATRQPDLNRVPAKVRKLLQRCLEKDPKRRLRDIGEAWFLLENDAEPIAPIATAPPLKRNAPVILAALSMLALAALAFVHFREPKWAPPARVQFDIGAPDKVTLGPYLRLSPDGRRIAFRR